MYIYIYIYIYIYKHIYIYTYIYIYVYIFMYMLTYMGGGEQRLVASTKAAVDAAGAGPVTQQMVSRRMEVSLKPSRTLEIPFFTFACFQPRFYNHM